MILNPSTSQVLEIWSYTDRETQQDILLLLISVGYRILIKSYASPSLQVLDHNGCSFSKWLCNSSLTCTATGSPFHPMLGVFSLPSFFLKSWLLKLEKLNGSSMTVLLNPFLFSNMSLVLYVPISGCSPVPPYSFSL